MSSKSEENIKKYNEKTFSDQGIIGEKNSLTLDEKLRLAVRDSKIFEDNKGEYLSSKTNPCTTENITGASSKHIFNNITEFNLDNDQNGLNIKNFFNVSIDPSPVSIVKRKKIFKIKKYVKYNKYLTEIFSDEEVSDNDKIILKDPKSKKISPFSKVNFSKLKSEEKDERLKNLAKLVKRLRRKVRNLELKVRFNATKLLNKHLWNKLGINSKNKYLLPEFEFDFDKVCKSLKKVRNFNEFEFDDQKHLIENIINFIADDKLKLDSIQYKKICSILRNIIPKEKIKYISKKDSKITISFPETECYITHKEYSKIGKYKDSEDVLRAVLGLYEIEKDKTVKIAVNPPEELNYVVNNKIEQPLIRQKNLFIDNMHQPPQQFLQGPHGKENSNLFINNIRDVNPALNYGNFYNSNNDMQNWIFNNNSNLQNLLNNNIDGNNQNYQQLQNLLLNSYQNYCNGQMINNLSNINNFNFNNIPNVSGNFNNFNNMNKLNNLNINQPNQFQNTNINMLNINPNLNIKPSNVFIK
jgi:hypothetical protein